MFNRRYFLLHGGWITYFKDEKVKPPRSSSIVCELISSHRYHDGVQMRYGECYGHICLTPSCQAKQLPSKERCFVLKNKVRLHHPQ